MKPIRKFKKGDIVRFIGGQEENYHDDYKNIMAKQGVVSDVFSIELAFPDHDLKWPYEITIDNISYPVNEKEIEAV